MLAEIKTLEGLARRLRRHSLLMTSEAASGHPTTCMSCADLMAALFFREMKFDPSDPYSPEADAFVLSKGHAAPILWAALHEAGAIREDLLTLRRITSTLEGHPTPRSPWVRVATGSLGQGLSAGVGMAIARRMDKRTSRVYVLLGDGETAEGAVWEAAQHASHLGLDNLCAIVDLNALGQSGPTMLKHDAETMAARWRAFGWEAKSIDGHHLPAILDGLDVARRTSGRPTVLIAKTQKGRGVSFLEGQEGWHGKPLKKGPELEKALAELGTNGPLDVPRREERGSPSPRPAPRPFDGHVQPAYKLGQEVATREAYGSALVALGKLSADVVVLDAEVKNSTFTEKFKNAHPDRFVECFIAEQQMVGAALGLAAEGKIPFASSFACFLSRAFDFIRMAAYSQPPVLVLCGSHVGVSIGEDGPSQMGLEDIAMFRAVIGSTVLYPCDAVSAERLTEQAARAKGIVYLRTSRPKTPVLYENGEEFPIGGSKVLRRSASDSATIVAAGVTVYEALAAADRLKGEGIAVRVIDAYSVKPIDAATFRTAARETGRIITVEDHASEGGLGEAVAQALAGTAPLTSLAVRELPRSGSPKELMAAHGIDADAIVGALKATRG
ncbi:MAG: transketolase [Planctomycetes bacterium]|nr:transketolase [Planctomycetota bacterium]